MTNPVSPDLFSSISDVERDIGVAKETLRVWERRYGFPQPRRDQHGERIYPADQVLRLKQIKRLIDQGYRPGKIMLLELDALSTMGAKASALPARGKSDPDLRACIELLKAHKLGALRERLAEGIARMGVANCIVGLIAPLTTLVGDEWAAGSLAVFEEHLYSDMLDGLLRAEIRTAPRQGRGAPRVLLTTVPQERHGLGLLMAEALLTLEGAHCITLGVQTPLGDIVAAARSGRVDIVALSFSGVTSTRAAVDNIKELHKRLGGEVEVWAGGSGAATARRHLAPGCVLDLNDVAPALARWHARQTEVAV